MVHGSVSDSIASLSEGFGRGRQGQGIPGEIRRLGDVRVVKPVERISE